MNIDENESAHPSCKGVAFLVCFLFTFHSWTSLQTKNVSSFLCSTENGAYLIWMYVAFLVAKHLELLPVTMKNSLLQTSNLRVVVCNDNNVESRGASMIPSTHCVLWDDVHHYNAICIRTQKMVGDKGGQPTAQGLTGFYCWWDRLGHAIFACHFFLKKFEDEKYFCFQGNAKNKQTETSHSFHLISTCSHTIHVSAEEQKCIIFQLASTNVLRKTRFLCVFFSEEKIPTVMAMYNMASRSQMFRWQKKVFHCCAFRAGGWWGRGLNNQHRVRRWSSQCDWDIWQWKKDGTGAVTNNGSSLVLTPAIPRMFQNAPGLNGEHFPFRLLERHSNFVTQEKRKRFEFWLTNLERIGWKQFTLSQYQHTESVHV